MKHKKSTIQGKLSELESIDLSFLSLTDRNSIIEELRLSSTSKKHAKNSLNQVEYHALKLLSKCVEEKEAPKKSLTKKELEFLQEFLIENMGNMDLNKRLGYLIHNKPNALPGQHIASWIKYFTYATTSMKDFIHLKNKLVDNLTFIDQENITKDKINLEEYGRLHRAASLKKIIEHFNTQFSQLFEHEKLKNFKQNIEETEQALTKLEERIMQEAQLTTGDLIFHSSDKIAKIRNQPISTDEHLLQKYITKYRHTAKVITKDEHGRKTYTQSHLTSTHSQDELDIKTYLHSDILKFDITKLISPETQKILQAKDENWREKLKAEYELIEKEIHDKSKTNFQGMTAALAPPNVLLSVASSIGITKKTREDFTQVHRKMTNSNGYKNMLCSAFIAREIVASLVELDNRIKEKYGIENAINFPFEKDIRLGRIAPGRLYDLMLKSGAFKAASKTPTELKVLSFGAQEKAREISGSKEELLVIVNEQIEIYKKQKKAKDTNALANLKKHLTEEVLSFVTRGDNPRSITIDEHSQKFVERHVEELTKHVDKQISKNFLIRWGENVINFIRRKKDKTIEHEALKITERLEDLVNHDEKNKSISRAEYLIHLGKASILEMKNLSLLDNLVDLEKLKELDDRSLRILHQIAMLDPSINYGSSQEFEDLYKKIDLSNKGIKPLSREDLIKDLENAINKRKPQLTLPLIQTIKGANSEIKFIRIEDRGNTILREEQLSPKLRFEITETIRKVEELRNHHLLNLLVTEVLDEISKKNIPIAVLKTYQKIGHKDPLKQLHEDLLSECKTIPDVSEKLKTDEQVNTFKFKLLEELKSGKMAGYIKSIYPQTTPPVTFIMRGSKIQQLATSTSRKTIDANRQTIRH